MVVGVGTVFGSLLMLFNPSPSEPEFFAAGLRVQTGVGFFVFAVGLALWYRQPWARIAALWLLWAGVSGTVAWSIYVAFDVTRSSGATPLFVVMLLLITGIWIVMFQRGISYLNQPSVVAELEGRAQ
jgi:hypothetical protein